MKKRREQTLAANEQARKAEAAAAELEKENLEQAQKIQRLMSRLKDAGIETDDPQTTPSTSQHDSTSGDNPRESSVRFSHTP